MIALHRRITTTVSARFVTYILREDPLPQNALGKYQCDSPEAMYTYWQSVIATQPDHEPDKECVVAVMLNTRLIAYAWNLVSLGTVSESLAYPREIFRPVIAAGAHAFCLAHSHPSGDPSPSQADERVTRRMVECAELVQIRRLDHIIIGTPAPGRSPYYSFREAGLV